MQLATPNILLIGGSGQDSFYLAKCLSLKRSNVTLLYRTGNSLIDNLSRYNNIVTHNVQYYNVNTISHFLTSNYYDYVVLIAGMVGNGMATMHPYTILETNLSILTSLIQAIVVSKYSPHLIYFSTTDVCDRCLESDDNYFDYKLVNQLEPKTNYGLSKSICGTILKSANCELSINYTVLYLGMHESWQRKGNYVLSKIKKTILDYRKTGILRKETYSNLDIFIDIGHAAEFMNLVAELLVRDLIKGNLYFNIGTSIHTSLFDLCCDILNTYGIDAAKAVNVVRSKKKIYFPKISMDWMNDLKLESSIPRPLSGKVLNEYYKP